MARRSRPDADNTLSIVTWTGLAAALFLATAALTFYNWEARRQDRYFWSLAALTALFIVAHAPLKWWAPAVRLALFGWVALVVGCAGLLWRQPLLVVMLVAIPAGIALKLWQVGDRLAEYLRGTLDAVAHPLPVDDSFSGDACVICGERGCNIIAPQWCYGFLYGGAWHIGRPRRVCPHHARLYAFPAFFISGLIGWWSIPGMFWTPRVLMNNVKHGGQILDEESARKWLGKDIEGPLGISWKEMTVPFLVIVLAIVIQAWTRPHR